MSSRIPDSELRRRIGEQAYRVTQEGETQAPFSSALEDESREGIYVDVVSGEALFCSRDKYDAGSGWPSFTRPIDTSALTEHRDTSHGMIRVEVRSRRADSHLGHVFDDGPPPSGRRFCINGAALRFVAQERLEQEGYARYRSLFEGVKSASQDSKTPL